LQARRHRGRTRTCNPGFTSENDPNSCVTQAIANYLVALVAPPRESICQPDHPPFYGGVHPSP